MAGQQVGCSFVDGRMMLGDRPPDGSHTPFIPYEGLMRAALDEMVRTVGHGKRIRPASCEVGNDT